MREMRSLAGVWGFQLDPDGTLTPNQITSERSITVPLPWQTEYPELQQYSGYAWYIKPFDIPEAWLTGEVLLHFGAVDYWCQVYVNGNCVGEHEGGYTPFTLQIRQALTAGENVLAVQVYDTVQTGHTVPRWWQHPIPERTTPPFQAATLPHGKQTWYVDVSGIWQDVTLSPVPHAYVTQTHITTALDGTVQVRVKIANPQLGTVRVTVDDTTLTAEANITTQAEVTLTLTIENPRLWTMDTPHLYTAEVVYHSEAGKDTQRVRFGVRQLETRSGQFLLNGEPIYLLSALDQDIYADTIYTPPSTDYLRDQFEKAKALGLNSLRCHIKPPDPRYLDLADEMGLLIWAEIPSWRTWHVKTTVHPTALYMDEAVKTRVRDTLIALIERDYNHPSLMIWTMVNEDWGTALQLSAPDRVFVRELYELCKQLDPTRLCVDNSPCPAPFGFSPHIKTDINDFHIYTNIPDQARAFDLFVDQFALSPSWLFSSYGDSERRGDEPIVLSEFGNWGMPSLKHIGSEAHGGEPAWGDLGPWWNPYDGEPGYPQGVLTRFQTYGLDRIWADYETFAEATQWHQFAALRYEIQAMRSRSALAGYVITELADIYWESNGLLDFARQPKAFHHRFKEFNAEDVIIVQPQHYAYWSDQAPMVGLVVSHYSAQEWQNVDVGLYVDGVASLQHTVETVERGHVHTLSTRRVTLPVVDHAAMVSLGADVTGSNGIIATSETPILVLPVSARKAAYQGSVSIVSAYDQLGHPAQMLMETTNPSTTSQGQPPSIAALPTSEELTVSATTFPRLLQGLGYQMTTAATSELIIADLVTTAVLEHVRLGANLLLISNGTNPFFWQQSRGGTYGGSWITTFSWLKSSVYRRLNGLPNPLSTPFMDIMPSSTLLAVPMENPAYQDDVLAGQVGGWIRHPAAHTVQFRLGEGKVILTTFSLLKTLGTSAIAVAMLHDLVDHLMSDDCQPTLQSAVGMKGTTSVVPMLDGAMAMNMP